MDARFAVDTKDTRFAVETKPAKFPVDTKLERLIEERYPAVPRPITVDPSCVAR